MSIVIVQPNNNIVEIVNPGLLGPQGPSGSLPTSGTLNFLGNISASSFTGSFTGIFSLTASNGLSKVGEIIQLGGTINQLNTFIPSSTSSNNLLIGWQGFQSESILYKTASGFSQIDLLSNGGNSSSSGELKLSGSLVTLMSNNNIDSNLGYLNNGSINLYSYIDNNIVEIVGNFNSGSNNSSTLKLTTTPSTSSINIFTNNDLIEIIEDQHITLLHFASGTSGGIIKKISLENNSLDFYYNSNDNNTPKFVLDERGLVYSTGGTLNSGGLAITDVTATASQAIARGFAALAMGRFLIAAGKYSFAGGQGISTRILSASGQASFNFSENNSNQTNGHGALASQSAILGGLNHNIPTGSDRSIILGGDTIKAIQGITDTVYIPKLRINLGNSASIVSSSNSTSIIVRNTASGELETKNESEIQIKLINYQTGSSYTVSFSDFSPKPKLTIINSAISNSVIFPSSSVANFQTGSQLQFYISGSGLTTFSTGSTSVRIRSLSNKISSNGQHSIVWATKTEPEVWVLSGDLS